MFIIPSSEVLLLGAAVVLVLASEQWPVSGAWLRILRFQRPEGGIGDEQAAVYPALTRNPQCPAQRLSAHRVRHESPERTSVVWALATLAIVGLLTTMLMVGIAISV